LEPKPTAPRPSDDQRVASSSAASPEPLPYQVAREATTGGVQAWRQGTVRSRCRTVGSVRHHVAAARETLVAACRSEQRTADVETVASELIPLCDALRWIGRRGADTLRTRRVGVAGRPVWLTGVSSVVRRQPLGTVLILGTWNYPLLLAGVQAAQALAAGNRVIWKPSPGCERASKELAACFHRAGVPREVLTVIDSDPAAAGRAIEDGVDLVVLTGAATTGQAVLRQTASTITPTIMELSGADAMIVLPSTPDHLLDRAVEAARFGLLFNSGATCIGPRRLVTVGRPSGGGGIGERLIADLLPKLLSADPVVVHPAAREGVADLLSDALRGGATDLVGKFDAERLRRTGTMNPVLLDDLPPRHPVLRSDLFAPVLSLVPCEDLEAVIDEVNACPYRLAASVFGDSAEAERVAERLDVGVVTVNDLIAPTADPRLPFGGRGRSGFGVTRGREGLLAMTHPQAICVRRRGPTPHLSPRNDADADLLGALLQCTHGGSWSDRWAGLLRLTTAARRGGGLKK